MERGKHSVSSLEIRNSYRVIPSDWVMGCSYEDDMG